MIDNKKKTKEKEAVIDLRVTPRLKRKEGKNMCETHGDRDDSSFGSLSPLWRFQSRFQDKDDSPRASSSPDHSSLQGELLSQMEQCN